MHTDVAYVTVASDNGVRAPWLAGTGRWKVPGQFRAGDVVKLDADGSVRPAKDTGGLSRVCGTIVAMCRADHADQAMGMSTFGNPG